MGWNSDVIGMFFSFHGRLNRQPFWIRFFLLNISVNIVVSVLASVSAENGIDAVPYMYTLYALYWVSLSSLWMRRIQDMGTPWWWYAGVAIGGPLALALRIWVVSLSVNGEALGATLNMPSIILLLLVVINAIYVFVRFGFSRGTIGENAYGKDPLAVETPRRMRAKLAGKRK